MKVKEIYNLAVQKGVEADLRGKDAVERLLERKRKNYEKLSEEQKKGFDKELIENPYLDSRILYEKPNQEIKKVLVGIDIGPAEILLAKKLEGIDLVISHHPLGKSLANLHEVMELQSDVLSQYGVPINIAERLTHERMSEVARGVNSLNHERTVDTAKLLDVSLMCLHTTADNLAARFLKDKIGNNKDLVFVEDIISLLENIPEYKKAIALGAGPKIFVGKKQGRCGKIALTEITGGTEGSPKLYEKMAIAGVGTIVGMHISEEHKKEAEAANINIVIAGHMSSDSLGMNLFLDELEEKIEIVPCSGLIRVSRISK